jgi:hypothetical protein
MAVDKLEAEGLKEASQLLNPNEILMREFEYAAQTASQANEDRARLFLYYLATAGTLVATVVAVDLTGDQGLLLVFALLFAGLSVLGIVSFLQLIKLRLAWTESARAMCQIKEFYIRAYGPIRLKDAFRWRMATIPAASRKWTVAFLMAVVTALLGSACVGAAVLLAGWGWRGRPWSVPGAVTALLAFAGQLILWSRLCRD